MALLAQGVSVRGYQRLFDDLPRPRVIGLWVVPFPADTYKYLGYLYMCVDLNPVLEFQIAGVPMWTYRTALATQTWQNQRIRVRVNWREEGLPWELHDDQ